MATKTKKTPKAAPVTGSVRFHQVIDENDFKSLTKLKQVKGFDTEQALIRFIVREFLRKNSA